MRKERREGGYSGGPGGNPLVRQLLHLWRCLTIATSEGGVLLAPSKSIQLPRSQSRCLT